MYIFISIVSLIFMAVFGVTLIDSKNSYNDLDATKFWVGWIGLSIAYFLLFSCLIFSSLEEKSLRYDTTKCTVKIDTVKTKNDIKTYYIIEKCN